MMWLFLWVPLYIFLCVVSYYLMSKATMRVTPHIPYTMGDRCFNLSLSLFGPVSFIAALTISFATSDEGWIRRWFNKEVRW